MYYSNQLRDQELAVEASHDDHLTTTSQAILTEYYDHDKAVAQ